MKYYARVPMTFGPTILEAPTEGWGMMKAEVLLATDPKALEALEEAPPPPNKPWKNEPNLLIEIEWPFGPSLLATREQTNGVYRVPPHLLADEDFGPVAHHPGPILRCADVARAVVRAGTASQDYILHNIYSNWGDPAYLDHIIAEQQRAKRRKAK